MRGYRHGSLGAVLLAVAAVGCATGEATPDARIGGDTPDAAISIPDAMPGTPDAMPGTPDAMPSTPDAMPSPDAMVSTPDAMVGTPDAGGGCTTMTLQLLANPGFDSGPGSWVESEEIILSAAHPLYPLPIAPDTPSYAAWLGGADNATFTIYQDVAIPAGATNVSVSGSRLIGTTEILGVDYDKFTLSIRTTGGTVLETYQPVKVGYTWGNLDAVAAWTPFSWAVAGNYAGQTVRVHLTNTNDISDNTNFFMDSYAVRATVCQ